MTGKSSSAPSDPTAEEEFNKTPGQLIFAALVCFFGGIFIAVFSFFLGMIFQSEKPLVLAGLMGPCMVAAHFLIVATIISCIIKKPGINKPGINKPGINKPGINKRAGG